MTYLSGYFLEADGWKRKGFIWTKKFMTITYDGTNWSICTVDDIEKVNEGGIKINWRIIQFVEEIKKNKRW